MTSGGKKNDMIDVQFTQDPSQNKDGGCSRERERETGRETKREIEIIYIIDVPRILHRMKMIGRERMKKPVIQIIVEDMCHVREKEEVEVCLGFLMPQYLQCCNNIK